MNRLGAAFLLCLSVSSHSASADKQKRGCDQVCLAAIANQYMDAYRSRQPASAPFSAAVRYSENNVAMRLPDGSWNTITREIGPALVVSDAHSGAIGILTSIMQHDVPGYLAIRLKVRARRIVEVEQFVATQRNLSLARLGDVNGSTHDPDIDRPVEPGARVSRAELVAAADGYFATMEKNDGTMRGIRFAPSTKRLSNGVVFADVGKTLENGFFRFNDRVRDRNVFAVDQDRGIVLTSVIIDHTGQIDSYTLADGSTVRSPYREPHSLMGIELFKIKAGLVTAMETVYVQLPYNMKSAWRRTREKDQQEAR